MDTSSRRWAGEDVLRAILDASVLSICFAEVDEDFLDTIFSLIACQTYCFIRLRLVAVATYLYININSLTL